MTIQGKVTTEHLQRLAYLYVRQSSLHQVHEHRESTARQYELKRRARALGWSTERLIIIDEDQGLSGASAAERSGFQRMVAEVGLGRVGVVMGLEVSRLARNSADWHRLLEICALSNTLILDEDGIYDPSHFNDRLLLGLKGTMSEAELHLLRARLLGGQLNKARRGELWIRPPIGYVFDPRTCSLVLDPDEQIQEAVRLLFETFRRTGSALKVVRYFGAKGLVGHDESFRGFEQEQSSVRRWSITRCSELSTIRAILSLRLWSYAVGEDSDRWPTSLSACSSARVESLFTQLLPRLHQLGAIRGESRNLAGQCPRPRIRPAA